MPPYFILKSIAMTLRLLRKLLPPIHSSPDEIKYIPSRDPGRSIKIHTYRPPSSPSSTSTATPTPPVPVHLNLCGSGFVLPGHGLDDAYCRHLSTSVPTTVIDIQYRLAPEHPFPAALHDAEDALRWVQAQPETYDASRISIGGFSAGAALAVSLAGQLKADTFRALVAFYPAVDASLSPWKKHAPEKDGRPLPGWLLWVFQSCYLHGGGKEVVRDTKVSPALVEDLSAFPKRCLFVTAGQCSLAGEAEELGERLAAWANRAEQQEGEGQGERSVVVVQRMEGCGHAWDKFAKEGSVQWEMKERAYAMAVEILI